MITITIIILHFKQIRHTDDFPSTGNRLVLLILVFRVAGSSTSEAIAFIKDQFVKRQPKDKTVYTHVSCAIDTDLMRCIIRDVMNIIVEINLRKANMPL